MAGRQHIGAEIAGHVEKVDEFDLLVARHAGNRRLAIGVGLGAVGFSEATGALLSTV